MKKHFPIAVIALLGAFSFPILAQTPDAPPEQFATFSVWSQRMDMSPYKGKKYRLSVAIRTEPAGTESFAIAFIRNEPPEGGLRSWTYVDNMSDRPVRDSTWKTYTLRYAVDKKAPWIAFGMLGFGSGSFYFDDMRLEVEVEKGKWKAIPIPNGNFEQETLAPWEQTSQGVPVRVIGAAASADTQKPFEGKRSFRIKNIFLASK